MFIYCFTYAKCYFKGSLLKFHKIHVGVCFEDKNWISVLCVHNPNVYQRFAKYMFPFIVSAELISDQNPQ